MKGVWENLKGFYLFGILRRSIEPASYSFRAKMRIQLLERELARLAGENWQSSLDIAPVAPFTTRRGHHRSSSIASSIMGPTSRHSPSLSPFLNSSKILDESNDLSNASNTFFADPDSTILGSSGQLDERSMHPALQSRDATLAHIESIRLLVLGMEQRLQTREEKLVKTVEKAENEGKKFESFKQELTSRMDPK